MIIREATVDDLRKLASCAEDFYASSKYLNRFDLDTFCASWTALLGSGLGVIFVADHDGELVGAISGARYPDVNSGEMVAMEFFWFVKEAFRGCGLRLYLKLENWARDNKCKVLRMAHLVDLMPDKVEAFYLRRGYDKSEVIYAMEL